MDGWDWGAGSPDLDCGTFHAFADGVVLWFYGDSVGSRLYAPKG
jgi:hypothetical protein